MTITDPHQLSPKTTHRTIMRLTASATSMCTSTITSPPLHNTPQMSTPPVIIHSRQPRQSKLTSMGQFQGSTQHTNHTKQGTAQSQLNDTFGDFPTSPKPLHHFRILYSNINGISTTNFDQECHQIGYHTDAYHIDFLACVETVSYTHLTLPTIA